MKAEGVSFTYPRAPEPALSAVSLDVLPGHLTILLGPNGSGKSTLLALLAGLHRPASGRVTLDERDPFTLPRGEVARLVAFLPAKAIAPADYSAREIVLMGRHPFGRGLLLERPRDVARADEALSKAGALPFGDRPCSELSSGERQRVLLARALCQDVPALLLDEPSSAQDLAHALDQFEQLARLARDEGRTVVVATHAINLAARFADRLVVLSNGRVVADGRPSQVLSPELLADVFEVDAILGRDDHVPYAVPRARVERKLTS